MADGDLGEALLLFLLFFVSRFFLRFLLVAMYISFLSDGVFFISLYIRAGLVCILVVLFGLYFIFRRVLGAFV